MALLESAVWVDNKLLDWLFQPIVRLCPDRARAMPAGIAVFAFVAVMVVLAGYIVCRVFALADVESGFGLPRLLTMFQWVGVASFNHFLLIVCVDVARQQNHDKLNWFREKGIVFRYPLLFLALASTLWFSDGSTGWDGFTAVLWLWWIGTCFMGCEALPPKKRMLAGAFS
jgi:hypothetical protein